jgi:hypothetical protein
MADHNFNAVISLSFPPQTTAASSAVVLGRGHYSSLYSPDIGLARRLFDAHPNTATTYFGISSNT